MTTWIALLRIAENLLGAISGPDATQFAIGGIAPDSVSLDVNDAALA